MIEELKADVYQANMQLKSLGLVILTWGNVSAIDREKGFVIIKPSGVPYETMSADDMVVLDLSGNVIEGRLKPSSDTPTHLELYKKFPEIGAVVHTHSTWAASWAQAGRDIPAYGTTHADFADCAVPCTRPLTSEEVNSAYELNTGSVIVETFTDRKISPSECPAVLVQRHGPFCWGKDCFEAVNNALILEETAKMAWKTEEIAAYAGTKPGIEEYLLRKHYERKHGANAYYGQK